ncbi:zinc finger protein 37-like [Anopheles cruzii]|uniref:zinc finger protein 37-like n=1 Tax=Anopheles cruzii TaxID=68878 RepID=UPI0022EC783E|nr:zinc finger protein 37-like [Anopheles cruzii]
MEPRKSTGADIKESGSRKREEMLVNVQLNGDDDIDVVPVLRTDESSSEDGDELSDNMDSDPELVKMADGRLMLDIKRTKCCIRCKKPFKTTADMKAHKSKCTGVVDVAHETIKKERLAAKFANPSEEFHKYCNPNPEQPCYCCGEDVTTAHVGHIRCYFCPKSFKAYEYMHRHIDSIHAESEDYACGFCNAKCSSQLVLVEHIKTHSEGKPFSCITCGKDFTRRYHLDRHAKHSNCGDTKKDVQPCNVCGKVFTRIDNLREHLRTHMGQSVRRRDYQCPHCPKTFYGSSLLNIHIRTHTGEKPFPCDLCPNSFPSTGALRKHRRKHTGERPYRCDECSATFAARETLNRHRKVHTNDKRHVCPECGKRFIQATQLRTHMYNHNGQNGFKCAECDATFARKTRLNEHVKFQHRKEEPYECNECTKQFLRKDDLMRHMIIHTGDKHFECPTCDKRFAVKASLTLHMKTHIVENPVQCKLCHGNFIRADCLLRHMKSKHRDCLEDIQNEIERLSEKDVKPKIVPNAASVEINGEVYQITTMEATPSHESEQLVELVELDVVSEDAIDETSSKRPSTSPGRIVLTLQKEKGTKADTVSVGEAKPTLIEVQNDPVEAEVLEEVVEEVVDSTHVEVVAPQKEKTSPSLPQTVPEVKSEAVLVTSPVAKSKDRKPRTVESKASVRGKKSHEAVADDSSRKRSRIFKGRTSMKRQKPDDDSIPIFLSDSMLMDKVSELLQMLIGEEMLKEFGWPKAPVDDVLVRVIRRCGHQPAKGEEAGDHTTRMRENTKILFSVTMDDNDVKALLNNHTVDEVIMHVLKSK